MGIYNYNNLFDAFRKLGIMDSWQNEKDFFVVFVIYFGHDTVFDKFNCLDFYVLNYF